MSYEAKMQFHAVAAAREEDAAAQAVDPSVARLHAALAEMHRHEAAKMDSVRRTLRLAFGE